MHKIIPLQNWGWQFLDSVDSPEHGFPPNTGSGFEHFLWRVCSPDPHVTLQGVHAVHRFQPPSTETLYITQHWPSKYKIYDEIMQNIPIYCCLWWFRWLYFIIKVFIYNKLILVFVLRFWFYKTTVKCEPI